MQWTPDLLPLLQLGQSQSSFAAQHYLASNLDIVLIRMNSSLCQRAAQGAVLQRPAASRVRRRAHLRCHATAEPIR